MRELSSVDFHFLAKELQHFVGERIDQIYAVGKKDFVFQFRFKDGKQFLRIGPDFLFITKVKDIGEGKNDFVSFLRKVLSGRKIRAVEQVGSERLIRLKTDNTVFYSFFFKLKDKILCNRDDEIIASTNTREYKKGGKFLPDEKNNFAVPLALFKTLIEKIDKNIAKTLAINLGIGGFYAEEICMRAGISRDKENLSSAEEEKLYDAFSEILKSKTDAFVVYKNGIPVDAVPFEIRKYQSFKKEKTETFNDAVAVVVESTESQIKQKQKSFAYEQEKERLLKIKDIQGKNLAGVEKESGELQRTGEIIYEKYQELKQILDEAGELRKTHSFKEIKEILKKKHLIVKDLDEKEKKLMIEI